MEEIVKAVNNAEYDTAAILILLDNLDHGDLEKLLYFFVYKLIEKNITERTFVEMVNYMNRTKIDFTVLKQIKQLSELLADEKYNIASELLMTLRDMKNINNELTKFIDGVLNSNGILHHKIKDLLLDDINNKYGVDIITKSYDILHEAKEYVKSFSKLSHKHPSNFGINKDDTENIIEKFENNCKNEVMERLILLRHYYGIHFLSNIGIAIITVNDFIAMKYNGTIKYYFGCIKKIKRNIRNHLKLYKNFIRLHKYYNNLISNFSDLDNQINLDNPVNSPVSPVSPISSSENLINDNELDPEQPKIEINILIADEPQKMNSDNNELNELNEKFSSKANPDNHEHNAGEVRKLGEARYNSDDESSDDESDNDSDDDSAIYGDPVDLDDNFSINDSLNDLSKKLLVDNDNDAEEVDENSIIQTDDT